MTYTTPQRAYDTLMDTQSEIGNLVARTAEAHPPSSGSAYGALRRVLGYPRDRPLALARDLVQRPDARDAMERALHPEQRLEVLKWVLSEMLVQSASPYGSQQIVDPAVLLTRWQRLSETARQAFPQHLDATIHRLAKLDGKAPLQPSAQTAHALLVDGPLVSWIHDSAPALANGDNHHG